MFDFIKFSKYCIAFSIIITLVGIGAFLYNGLVAKIGFLEMDIEFKGGNIIEVNIGKQYNANEVADIVKKASGFDAVVQKLGTNQEKASIRTEVLTDEQVTAVVNALKAKYELKEDVSKIAERINKVEPTIGKEIWGRGLLSVALASIAILMYVAFRFRTMQGLSAGTTAIIALVHDAFIMFTVYAILRIPVNSNFIAAVLTILGYSINDTIIVYDRIRENQNLMKKLPIDELTNRSINQTLARTVKTGITVLIALCVLYIYAYINGIQSIKEFSLPLIIGFISGTYSSIFVAAPLWAWWQNLSHKGKISGGKSPKANPA